MNARLRNIAVPIVMGFASFAHADDTMPDPTFGEGGTVWVEPSMGDNYNSQSPTVLQHEDATYLLHRIERSGKSISRVTRLDASGDIDDGYGASGHVELVGLDGFYDAYQWSSGLVDDDGGLYLAGHARVGTNTDMLVCRVSAMGQFDGEWGENNTGCTTIGFDLIPFGHESAYALALQDNKRLLVGGTAKIEGGYYAAAIARLNAAGQIDGSLNGGMGTVTVSHSEWNTLEMREIALDSQQRIVIAGTVRDPKNGSNQCDAQFVVARLLPDGTADEALPIAQTGWDLGPSVDIDCALTRDAVIDGGLHIYPDDSILLVGNAQVSADLYELAAMKITHDGILDDSFGNNGKMHRPICDSCYLGQAISSSVQADGKIVIAGVTSLYSDDDVFVTRLLPDGSDDAGFVNAGAVLFDYAHGGMPTNDYCGTIDTGSGRILLPVWATEVGAPLSDSRLAVTALGELEGGPVMEINLFADGFE